MTEGEKELLEKLGSMHDPITSDDLRGVDPRTEREYLMVMLPVEISMLKRLEEMKWPER